MAKLMFGDLYMYNATFLRSLGTPELSAEYNRLRKIALKRLDALSRSEFKEGQTYKKNAGLYNKTAREMSRSELIDALTAVGHFVGAKGGSLRGLQRIRAKAISTLHEHGYTFVNRANFKAFTDFMEAWRDEHPPGDGSPTPSELIIYIDINSNKRLGPKAAKEFFEKYVEEHGQTDLLE